MAMILCGQEIDNTSQKALMDGQVLGTTDNLNNIRDYGIYSWTSGNSPSNVPVAGTGCMIVLKIGTAECIQIVFVLGSTWGSMRFRMSSGSSAWRDWITVQS